MKTTNEEMFQDLRDVLKQLKEGTIEPTMAAVYFTGLRTAVNQTRNELLAIQMGQATAVPMLDLSKEDTEEMAMKKRDKVSVRQLMQNY